jgi:rsbT antagonist protein RsbS
MERIPILKLSHFLLVTIQVDLNDQLVGELETNLLHMVRKTNAQGVLIDVSGVDTLDSFMGRVMIGNIGRTCKLLGAETALVGMQSAVAITLVQRGLRLRDVQTALNVEKGLELLKGKIAFE